MSRPTSACELKPGFVGLEVTKRSPFVVLKVDDLMDKNGVMQGEPSYTNAAVLANDRLLLVGGVCVEKTTVVQLHDLLGGPIDSIVELVLCRAQTGEVYSIQARRHAPHAKCATLERAPIGDNTPSRASLTVDREQNVAVGERLKVLEKEKASLELANSQLVIENQQVRQECQELQRAAELQGCIRASIMEGKKNNLEKQLSTDGYATPPEDFDEELQIKLNKVDELDSVVQKHEALCKSFQLLTDELKEAKSLESRLAELQRDSNSKDCEITELTSRLTAEMFRAMNAEADLRKVHQDFLSASKRNEDLEAKMLSMQLGNEGMKNDLNKLELEKEKLFQQLSTSRQDVVDRTTAIAAMEDLHERAVAALQKQLASESERVLKMKHNAQVVSGIIHEKEIETQSLRTALEDQKSRTETAERAARKLQDDAAAEVQRRVMEKEESEKVVEARIKEVCSLKEMSEHEMLDVKFKLSDLQHENEKLKKELLDCRSQLDANEQQLTQLEDKLVKEAAKVYLAEKDLQMANELAAGWNLESSMLSSMQAPKFLDGPRIKPQTPPGTPLQSGHRAAGSELDIMKEELANERKRAQNAEQNARLQTKRLFQAEEESAHLQTQTEELEQKLCEVGAELQEAEDHNEKLRLEMAATERKHSERCAELAVRLSDAEKTVEKMQEKVQVVGNELVKKMQEVAAWQKERDHLEREHSERCAELAVRLSDAEKTVDKMHEKAEIIGMELVHKMQEMTAWAKERDHLEAEVQSLKQSLERKRDLLKNNEQVRIELTEQIVLQNTRCVAAEAEVRQHVERTEWADAAVQERTMLLVADVRRVQEMLDELKGRWKINQSDLAERERERERALTAAQWRSIAMRAVMHKAFGGVQKELTQTIQELTKADQAFTQKCADVLQLSESADQFLRDLRVEEQLAEHQESHILALEAEVQSLRNEVATLSSERQELSEHMKILTLERSADHVALEESLRQLAEERKVSEQAEVKLHQKLEEVGSLRTYVTELQSKIGVSRSQVAAVGVSCAELAALQEDMTVQEIEREKEISNLREEILSLKKEHADDLQAIKEKHVAAIVALQSDGERDKATLKEQVAAEKAIAEKAETQLHLTKQLSVAEASGKTGNAEVLRKQLTRERERADKAEADLSRANEMRQALADQKAAGDQQREHELQHLRERVLELEQQLSKRSANVLTDLQEKISLAEKESQRLKAVAEELSLSKTESQRESTMAQQSLMKSQRVLRDLQSRHLKGMALRIKISDVYNMWETWKNNVKLFNWQRHVLMKATKMTVRRHNQAMFAAFNTWLYETEASLNASMISRLEDECNEKAKSLEEVLLAANEQQKKEIWNQDENPILYCVGLTMPIDFDRAAGSEEVQRSFDESLKTQICATLSISPENVQLLCHQRGSFKVEVVLSDELPRNEPWQLQLGLIRAQHLPKMDVIGTADAYVTFDIRGQEQQKSQTINNTLNPEWKEDFVFNIDDQKEEMLITIWDWDGISKGEVIGEVRLQLCDLSGNSRTRTFNILEKGTTKYITGKDSENSTVTLSLNASNAKADGYMARNAVQLAKDLVNAFATRGLKTSALKDTSAEIHGPISQAVVNAIQASITEQKVQFSRALARNLQDTILSLENRIVDEGRNVKAVEEKLQKAQQEVQIEREQTKCKEAAFQQQMDSFERTIAEAKFETARAVKAKEEVAKKGAEVQTKLEDELRDVKAVLSDMNVQQDNINKEKDLELDEMREDLAEERERVCKLIEMEQKIIDELENEITAFQKVIVAFHEKVIVLRKNHDDDLQGIQKRNSIEVEKVQAAHAEEIRIVREQMKILEREGDNPQIEVRHLQQRKEEAKALMADRSTHACEWGCTFTGSFDEVVSHEATCKLNTRKDIEALSSLPGSLHVLQLQSGSRCPDGSNRTAQLQNNMESLQSKNDAHGNQNYSDLKRSKRRKSEEDLSQWEKSEEDVSNLPIALALKYPADFDAVLSSPEATAKFDAHVQRQVSSALGIPPAGVQVICHQRGSIIADVVLKRVKIPGDGNYRTPALLAKELMEMVEDRTSDFDCETFGHPVVTGVHGPIAESLCDLIAALNMDHLRRFMALEQAHFASMSCLEGKHLEELNKIQEKYKSLGEVHDHEMRLELKRQAMRADRAEAALIKAQEDRISLSEWSQVQHELRRQIDGLLADRNHLACLLELQRTDKKTLESQDREMKNILLQRDDLIADIGKKLKESVTKVVTRDKEQLALVQEVERLKHALEEARRAKGYYSSCYNRIQTELGRASEERELLQIHVHTLEQQMDKLETMIYAFSRVQVASFEKDFQMSLLEDEKNRCEETIEELNMTLQLVRSEVEAYKQQDITTRMESSRKKKEEMDAALLCQDAVASLRESLEDQARMLAAAGERLAERECELESIKQEIIDQDDTSAYVQLKTELMQFVHHETSLREAKEKLLEEKRKHENVYENILGGGSEGDGTAGMRVSEQDGALQQICATARGARFESSCSRASIEEPECGDPDVAQEKDRITLQLIHMQQELLELQHFAATKGSHITDEEELNSTLSLANGLRCDLMHLKGRLAVTAQTQQSGTTKDQGAQVSARKDEEEEVARLLKRVQHLEPLIKCDVEVRKWLSGSQEKSRALFLEEEVIAFESGGQSNVLDFSLDPQAGGENGRRVPQKSVQTSAPAQMEQEPVILIPSHKVEVTLCAARHLPHVDGWLGKCDAFVEFVCKDQTQKSTVKKNSLDPDWKPVEKFTFDLSSGEMDDIQIQLKDCNMTSSAKLLGTTVIGVDALKRLMAGDNAALPSDVFLITAPDGKPLMGKQQTHLLLKVAAIKMVKGSPATFASPQAREEFSLHYSCDLYNCDFNCGFRGGFEQVAEHEPNCELNPSAKQNVDSIAVASPQRMKSGQGQAADTSSYAPCVSGCKECIDER